MKLKGTEIVEKKNVLNEIRHNDMTLQELRFFSIYLSKINARDESTRKVKFKLEEFKKIMNIGRLNIQHFKNVTDSLLCKILHVPNEDGTEGFTGFQIFKECKVYKKPGECNQWYVEIDAHDKALPLMFNLKSNYFKYEIWNALRLKSRNQLHMYELLKQYEKIGIREIPLIQLKDWLGLSENEYKRWEKFKTDVLNKCQIALKKYTDIKYDYEIIKTGRKVTGVRFIISKNKEYEDQLQLSEFIKIKKDENIDNQYDNELNDDKELIKSLSNICNNEFSEAQMIVIKDLLVDRGYCKEDNQEETCEFLHRVYHEVNAQNNIPRDATERRYGFIKWFLKNDLSDKAVEESTYSQQGLFMNSEAEEYLKLLREKIGI